MTNKLWPYRKIIAWLILVLNIIWGFFRYNHLFSVEGSIIKNPGYQVKDYPTSTVDLLTIIVNDKWLSNVIFITINILVSILVVYLYTNEKRQISYVIFYFCGLLLLCGITALLGVSLDLPTVGLYKMIKFYKDLMLSPLIAAFIILFQKFKSNFA